MASNVITKVLRLKDEASGTLGKVGGAAKSTTEQLNKTGTSAARAGSTAQASGRNWTELSSKMNVMAQGAKAAVNSLKAMTQALADSRNELADTSTRTGLTIKTLAGLRLAAEGSGQKLGSLASGLQQLPKRMADVARGTGEALIAFDALGVSATDDVTGKLRPADEVLRDLISSLNEVTDNTERSSLATQAFGRAGGALMQALSGSSLEDFSDLAEKYGVSLAPEAIKQSAAWERAIANLGLVFDGLKDSMSAALGGEGQGGAVSLIQDVTAGFLFMGTVATEVAGAISDTYRNMMKPIMAGFEAVHGNMSAAEQIMAGFDFKTTGFDRIMDADVNGKATAAMEEFRKAAAGAGAGGGGAASPDMEALGSLPGFEAPDTGSRSPATPAAAAAAAGGAAKAAPAPIVDELVDQSGQLQDLRSALMDMLTDTASEAKKAAETFAVPLKLSEQLAATQADAQLAWNGLAETAFDMGLAFEQPFIDMAETAQAEIAAIGVAFKQAVSDEKKAKIAGFFNDIVGGIGAISDPTAALAAAGPAGAAAAAGINLGKQGAAAEEAAVEADAQATADKRAAKVQEQIDLRKAQGASDAEIEGLEAQKEKAAEITGADMEQAQANAEANAGFMAGFVQDILTGILDAVRIFIVDLPAILFEVIPQFIIGIIGSLIPALIKMIPNFTVMFFTKLPEALIKGFKKAFQDIWQSIKDFFSNIFKMGKEGKNVGQKIGNTISDVLTFGQGRKVHEFHSGGFVPRDGQFLLKQGERVVPPTGADTQTAGRGLAAFSGGGANVTINTNVVDPNAIDALGRQLDRHFGSFGRSSLPVFGS